MIAFIKRLRAKRRKEAQLKVCRRDGHLLTRMGEMTPGKMVDGAAVHTGPAEYGLYSCACGYGEANEMDLEPYRRGYLEGKKMMEEQGAV